MLVLTRKAGQSIRIHLGESLPWKTPVGALFSGGPIEVVINAVDGDRVSLGITAHPDFLILRDELETPATNNARKVKSHKKQAISRQR